MVNTSDFYRSLNRYYSLISGIPIQTETYVNAELISMSQFKSDTDIVLPYIIQGRLISAKSYPDKNFGRITIAPETLKESLNKWVGIEIFTSHEVYRKILKGEDVSVNETVGKIIATRWNEKDNAIDFTAEIYDRTIAYKMDMGIIKFISAGFGRIPVVIKGEYYLTDIKPVEASLVKDPRDSSASFSAANL